MKLTVLSRVDADGVLRVAVPVGNAEAERDMQVTVESLPPNGDSQVDYLAWLDRSAGAWRGDFEPMPQGNFEARDAM